MDEARDSDGNVVIIKSKLCELLSPKVELMPNQRRDWRGYEICILSRSLQASLNSWIHIINIEQLAESRGWTRLSGVFQ